MSYDQPSQPSVSVKSSITLRDLYLKIVELYPALLHNEEEFLAKIISIFQKDRIRGLGMLRKLQDEGMNYLIEEIFLTNEFFHGAEEYVLSLGAPQETLDRIGVLHRDRKLLFDPRAYDPR